MHVPFEHPDAYDFLKTIKKEYLSDDDLVINLGDEIDGKSINFHSKSPQDLFTPALEFEECVKRMRRHYRLFPKVHLCESNHGSLVYRRASEFGLPLHVLKSYAEILETPNWEWHDDILLKTKMGDVYICHGKSATYGKLAKEMGCNAIQGHFHGKFEITWHRSTTTERYNLFSGCLIDFASLAFSYGKNHLPKPILGATILSENGYPNLIKMNLTDKGRWDKKLP